MKNHTYNRSLILLVILFFIVTSIKAKDKGLIKGIIKDEAMEIVPFATVILYNSSDSSLYKGEIADENGWFCIRNVSDGDYYLVAQMVGMGRSIKNNIQVYHDLQIDLGEIILKSGANNLQTVTVTAEKPFIEKRVDKTVVNIENSIIQTNVTASEMLEKLPGVMVDKDGNITLKGKQGVIILIDGKNTGLTGQDLTSFLKGLNSNNIEKVEIITNPSSKYDAAGNAGIINIIMKRNKRQGFNANTNINYSQGRYPKISNGFNMSYKDKWYNVFFNYSFNNRKTFTNLILNRKFYKNDSLKGMYSTDDYMTDYSKTHSPRMGLDIAFSQNTMLSFLLTSQYSSIDARAFDRTYNLDQNLSTIYYTEFQNKIMYKNSNYSFNTELKHQIDTLGQEIKINMDYSSYKNIMSQFYTTNYLLTDGSTLKEDVLYGDHLDKIDLYALKADYTKPLKGKVNLEAGVKSSYIKTSNNMRFYNHTIVSDHFDSLRSSLFDYSENINSAYINFNKGFRKITTQFGFRVEQTIAQGNQRLNNNSFNRNYVQVFPTFYAEYKLREHHSFNLNLGRRIDRPAYDQMNPFKKLLNPTTYIQGNPYLKPQYSYLSELTYVYENKLYLTLGLSTTKDNITEVLVQDAVTKITNQAIINLNRFDYYSLNISYIKRMTNWWTTNTSFLGYYGIYRGSVNNTSLDKKMPSFYFNSANSFSIKDGLSMELGFYYNYKVFYGVTIVKPMNNLSVGVQKSVLKNQGTLTLNISDLLWRSYARGITESGSVIESWEAKRDTRTFNISFSYKFGKGQLTGMRQNTGADEERNRVK